MAVNSVALNVNSVALNKISRAAAEVEMSDALVAVPAGGPDTSGQTTTDYG